MSPKGVVLAAGGVTLAVITINWVTSNQPGFVPPGRYLSAGVLYSLLYLAAGPLPGLGAAVAVGTTLAIVLNPVIQGNAPDQLAINRLTKWLNALAGQPATR
jgi:hypothetical protein